jgi:DNA-binding NarL/FixJ family response regulator
MRCLIAEDHPLMRQALVETVLGQWPGARIDEAADFSEAFAKLEFDPDLCLIDLAMPGADPVEGIARLRRRAPATPILIVTALADPVVLDAIDQIGVAGFISKNSEARVIVAAIEAALDGREMPQPAAPLPPRQMQVLQLLEHGLTNKEIAARLGIAPATTKIHVAALLANLGVSNRTKAVAEARRRGLI